MTDHGALMKQAVREIQSLRSALAEAKATRREPIAIVGMGCRFPGGANNPDAYWRLLASGTDAITEVPHTRWDVEKYYDADPDAPGKMYTRHGGFLGDIDRFDAQFFGVSPLDATNMDPQQRLLLEVAWEAFEHAGHVPGAVARTGVYIGSFMDDYLQLNFHASDPRAIDAYNTLGLLRGLAAGRLAYALDLHGPAMQLDTACSSSLLAAHLAVQALRNRECDLALAGGVNLILIPEITIGLCRMKAMAPDGRCKTFDARADGYVRGEGCGIVVLKRLSDAIADRDSVYAVIRGSAVNHDGRSNGLTAPNGSAQKIVIRDALADAGVAPEQIQFVEAHGTGTSLGDPIEAMALGEVLCQQRAERLLVGSVKSNFGHLESAAGAAALMKVALALHHGAVPPSLHFETPNPHIPWERLPITVPASLTRWPSATGRAAGISSFGMSGTNVHMILEQAPDIQAEVVQEPAGEGPYVLTISAATEDALDTLTTAYATQLGTARTSLRDLCHTSNVGRRHFEHRRAVTGESHEELARSLGQRPARKRSRKRPSIAFVFPGQGSRVAATEETLQSSLYAYQVELARRWISWGAVPDVVLGHSVGEFAAAAIAGVFTIDDGLQLIKERERLMHGLPARGTMAAVFADEARVVEAIRDTGLSIAAYNGSHLVISGPEDAMTEVSGRLRASGIEIKPLTVANAFHSKLMEPVLEPFEQAVSRFELHVPSTPFLSALTATLARGELTEASYWRRHVREPVRFADAVRSLETGIVLEIGPASTLLNIVRYVLDERTPELLQGSRIEESLAALYECGVDLDWSATPKRGARVALPAYPFQRKRYWVEGKSRADRRTSKRIPVPFSDDAHFEWTLNGEAFADHALEGKAVVPAATYLAMALQSIDGASGLRDVTFPQSLTMPLDGTRTLRLIAGSSAFRFASLRDEGQPYRDVSWVTHCSGTVDRESARTRVSVPQDLAALVARHGEEHEPSRDGDAGFAIGPSFRWTKSVREGDGEVLCRMHAAGELDAGFIDACLRTLAFCIRDGGTYVPVSIASLRLAARNGGTWCHARATETAEGRITGDVHLLDEGGNVVMEVLGLDARRIATARPDSLVTIEWRPLAPQPKRGARWLAQSEELAAQLQKHGEQVVAQDPTDVLCEASDGAALLALAQNASDVRVWVMTHKTQAVFASDRIDPAQAWAWGLGRVVALESPRTRWTTVDVDGDLGTFFEQCIGTNETEIAIRNGACWVPRLVSTNIEAGDTPLFRSDASYLVSGAFGAIGRQLTRWMASQGATHLVLVGRSPDPVEVSGANVLVATADVADRDAIARVFEQASASMPPIRGVFHAAGTLDDALLPDLTWERFESVFRAKVDGTRNLHHQSLALDLDHFVCFSSAASLIGSRGQANYAAANAYVDALAHHRRHLGYPALSINWSAWAGEGMAAREQDRLRALGFDPIDPAHALDLLGRIMRSGAVQIGVVPADWSTVLPALFDDAPPRFMELASEGAPPPRERLFPTIASTPAEMRRGALQAHLRALLISTMGRDPFPTSQNDVSFFELGMDSLMALDLRNRLQNDLDRALPSTVAFEYPTIPELAGYLIDCVFPAELFRSAADPAVAPQ